MKTIKMNNSNEIKRLSDTIAASIVTRRDAIFVPKSEWKALRTTIVKPEPSETPKKKANKTVSRRADFKTRGNRSATSKASKRGN